MTLIDNEKFYSSIINLKVGDKSQAAIVKDLQMHPARNSIVHVDLQRVVETEKIRIHIPIHFKGEAASPGVKSEGGVVSHRIADVEISCLPKDLPEFIEPIFGHAHGTSPSICPTCRRRGVSIPAIAKSNAVVVSIHPPRRGNRNDRRRCRDACRRRCCCSGRGRCPGRCGNRAMPRLPLRRAMPRLPLPKKEGGK
jgi:large subunit ribosomal protein L25